MSLVVIRRCLSETAMPSWDVMNLDLLLLPLAALLLGLDVWPSLFGTLDLAWENFHILLLT